MFNTRNVGKTLVTRTQGTKVRTSPCCVTWAACLPIPALCYVGAWRSRCGHGEGRSWGPQS